MIDVTCSAITLHDKLQENVAPLNSPGLKIRSGTRIANFLHDTVSSSCSNDGLVHREISYIAPNNKTESFMLMGKLSVLLFGNALMLCRIFHR